MRTSPRLNSSLARAAALLLLFASGLPAFACGNAGNPGAAGPDATASATTANVVNKAKEALRRMVLQPEQLPDGLQEVSDSFTSNDDYVASSPDPVAARENVERWGRILSHEATYQPTSDAAAGTAVRAITSTSSLYETAEGASLSFASGGKTIDETDWQAARPELDQFREERIDREGLADELVWLRLSGVSRPDGEIVVEDLIIFRTGRQRGFIQVVSAAPGEDRTLLLDEVEGWLKTQIQAARDALENAP